MPPELTLEQYIAQFKADGNLTHIFVQGSAQEEVVTENGTYPTIAKMVADNKVALVESLYHAGFAVRTYSFFDALELHVVHNMNSTRFTETIADTGGRRIFADVEPLSSSEFVVRFTEATSGSVTVVFCTNT
jgi:hypothetical protein